MPVSSIAGTDKKKKKNEGKKILKIGSFVKVIWYKKIRRKKTIGQFRLSQGWIAGSFSFLEPGSGGAVGTLVGARWRRPISFEREATVWKEVEGVRWRRWGAAVVARLW